VQKSSQEEKKVENIRKIELDELGRFLDLYYSSYPFFEGTPERKKKEADEIRKNIAKKPHYEHYGYFEDGEMLAIFIAYNYDMNFRGRLVKAGGIGSVGVDLLRKKEKICKKMVHYSLSKFKEEGKKFAILYPFRLDFYTNMGFGFGSQKYQYSIEPSSFRNYKKKGHLEFLKKDDIDLLTEFYNGMAEKGHGMIKRNYLDFEELIENPLRKIMVFKKDGKVLGYFWFRTKKIYDFNFIKNNFEIIEMLYDGMEVFEEFSTFLNTQSDQFDRVIVNTHDELFYHLFSNPSDGSNIMIPPVYHKTNNAAVGFMYRSLDNRSLVSFVESRESYANGLCVKLKIEDDLITDNDGAINFSVNGSKVEFSESKPDVEVEMKVHSFSSMIMGSVDLKSLVRYGKAKISDLNVLEELSSFFITGQKPVCFVGF